MIDELHFDLFLINPPMTSFDWQRYLHDIVIKQTAIDFPDLQVGLGTGEYISDRHRESDL